MDPGSRRDLRIDFFRGLALWFIFVDHVPSNVVSWVTVRNFGFSDATEIFVFLSGYSAALAYGRSIDRHGFGYTTAQVWRRAWQLYVAHIVLFVFYAAQAAYVADRFSNPMYVEELNLSHLLDEPHLALMEALMLRFRPANMDVLPMYIVLLLAFPLALACLRRWQALLVAGSLGLFVGARAFGWTLPTYPSGGSWFFNPFAWQLLFVYGALCAIAPQRYMPAPRWNRLVDLAAAAYLVFALWVVLSWRFAALEATVPQWLADLMYPIDKTNLDVLRLLHFLALAHLAARFVPRDARFLRGLAARPAVICGQQSLYVFCVGIYLSFATTFVLVEFDDSISMQILASAAGIAIMTALAALLTWYKRKDAVDEDRPAHVVTTRE